MIRSMILFIKHIDIEGPGTIETYLRTKGYALKTVDLGRGEPLPADPADFEAIVCLGGPMNVYEEEKYPFLKNEDQFIKDAVKKDVPFLGICLGSQLLAKASGVKVVKSPVKEVGWFKVTLKDAGRTDPLFKGIAKEFDVFHWHEDMFEIPQGATFLATSDGCPHQAYRVGKYAYGVQFHVEVTREIIADWSKAYFASHDEEKKRKAAEMLAAYDTKKADFNRQSEVIYGNFVELIAQRQKRAAAAKG